MKIRLLVCLTAFAVNAAFGADMAGNGNMKAALGEATFLTGLERNADVVTMSNPDWQKWKPVAIFRPYSVAVLRWSQSIEVSGTAQLWQPDLVSTADADVRITFSPDGRRMLWGRIGGANDAQGWEILESERRADGWSTPRAVTFNSPVNDFDPSFAPDGSGVYFFSNRPGGLGGDDIYFATFDSKTGRYGKPENLGAGINTPGNEWAPVVAPDGQRLMFASDGRGGKGKQDLFVARRQGKSWVDAKNLAALNTPDDDFDATFLHDGHSIIYTSGDVDGMVALYFAGFRDGRWLARQRLPESVNSTQPDAWTFGPAISASDPGAFYFTSRHVVGRGRSDIYRIEYQLIAR